LCATTWLSAPDPLGFCSFADALLTVITNTIVRSANVLELNSTNLLILILFIIRLRKMSFTGNNGLFDLLFQAGPVVARAE
jgi:hypothetical protein